MELKCKIFGKEYDIVQGATITDEYNETLDSGQVIIPNVPMIEDLKPYDDVYIYAGEFNGYLKPTDTNYVSKTYSFDTEVTIQSARSSLISVSYEGEELVNAIENGLYEELTNIQMVCNYYTINGKLSTSLILFSVSYDSTNNKLILNSQNTGTLFPSFTSNIELAISGNTISGTFYSYPDDVEVLAPTSNPVIRIISMTWGLRIVRTIEVETPTFYRHFLVDQFTEENMILGENVYKYKIQLFSETKGLETIQLPNISITQPLDYAKKKSVYTMLEQFVEQYSPVYKQVDDEDNLTWKFVQKYTLDTEGSLEIFKDVISPDFSLNNPNLRDVLSQLMLTKDRIPVVKDDVIYAMDITERVQEFDTTKGEINYIINSRSSDNHCDNLKRTYNNALSQRNTCKFVEYLGFRNSTTSLLTLENLRLETRFPIYKINKIYMCYYKKGKILALNNWVSGTSYEVGDKVNYPDYTNYYVCIEANSDTTFDSSKWEEATYEKMFLCKQDITPLVLLNSTRDLLDKDFDDFSTTQPTNIEEMATYRMCTIGYDIGSNLITGWGTKYTYVIDSLGWWNNTVTYIENIAHLLDEFNAFGIYEYGYLTSSLGENEIFYVERGANYSFNDVMLAPSELDGEDNEALKFKMFFFQIEYDGFFNGTVIHSKDIGRDNVTINDNSSSSLTLLEQDGLFMKEKANRFGNKATQINARYTSVDDIQPLGSYLDDDTIIYHREMSISNNIINVVYYGTKDYVLKNYFTSVYAKHRTYNLMSYSESVRRSENRKQYILISKDKCYYEKELIKFNYTDFDNYTKPIYALISAFAETEHATSKGAFPQGERMNYAYMLYNGNYYMSDLNTFSSGYSMCFNMSMYDNVSAGVYIKTLKPDLTIDRDVSEDWTGSVQSWLLQADSETGEIDSMGFYVCKAEREETFDDFVQDFDQSVIDSVYTKLLALPQISSTDIVQSNVIGNTYNIYKDNKEIIDMTFQIEPITSNDDIMFSQWFMKLCNLVTTENKIDETYEAIDREASTKKLDMITTTSYWYYTTEGIIPPLTESRTPTFFLRVTQTDFDDIEVGDSFSGTYSWQGNTDLTHWTSDTIIKVVYKLGKITAKTSTSLTVAYTGGITVDYAGYGKAVTYEISGTKVFYLTTKEEYVASGYLTFANDVWVTTYSPSSFTFIDNGGNERTMPSTLSVASNGKTLSAGQYLTQSTAVFGSVYLTKSGETAITTYTKNMFVDFSQEELTKTVVYDEFDSDNIPSTMSTSASVMQTFTIQTDNLGRDYIYVDISHTPQIKSLRYYYYSEESNSYHFVFGVNITDSEAMAGYTKIYLSLLSTRDERVYDILHNLVGTVYNYEDGEKNYGVNQYYSAIIEESEE